MGCDPFSVVFLLLGMVIERGVYIDGLIFVFSFAGLCQFIHHRSHGSQYTLNQCTTSVSSTIMLDCPSYNLTTLPRASPLEFRHRTTKPTPNYPRHHQPPQQQKQRQKPLFTD